jgi:hypothetical protein
MKVTPEIIQPFPNDGPRKTGGRKNGRNWILTDTPEKSETVNQRAKNGSRKYSGKATTIIVDCSEEIPHTDCVTTIM